MGVQVGQKWLTTFGGEASWGLLGPSWALLGPSWGLLGSSWSLSGPSWGHLGVILGPLGAILEPPGASKAERHIGFLHSLPSKASTARPTRRPEGPKAPRCARRCLQKPWRGSQEPLASSMNPSPVRFHCIDNSPGLCPKERLTKQDGQAECAKRLNKTGTMSMNECSGAVEKTAAG